MNTRSAVTLALVLTCALPVSAGLIESVRQRYTPTATISTSLSVSTWWSARERTESVSGRMTVAPNDRFRVELTGATWVCDGTSIWQYSSQSGQVVIKSLAGFDLSSHPSQMLSRYVNGYRYTVVETSERRATLRWQADSATAPTEFYRSIAISVDPRSATILSIVTVDRNQNRSTYEFSKTVFGAKVSPGTFTFTPPKGAHVFDDR